MTEIERGEEMSDRPSRQLTLTPIGVVKNSAVWPQDAKWGSLESELVIDPAWADGLNGVEEFSHLIVIFWIDRAGPPKALIIHPERCEHLPLVGLFATRSSHRPNPLGVTVVELLDRKGGVLRVRGLDTFDGTPILDIKPYLARGDRVEAPRHAAWLEGRWAEHDRAV
jgi:tRNA (adenine37-N6)-methyltransferase